MQIFILPHISPQKIFLHRFQHVLYTFQNSYFAYYLTLIQLFNKVEQGGAKITLFSLRRDPSSPFTDIYDIVRG